MVSLLLVLLLHETDTPVISLKARMRRVVGQLELPLPASTLEWSAIMIAVKHNF